MKIHFQTQEFAKALRQYQELSGKDMPEVMNKTAKDIAYRAAKLTPKQNQKWPVRKEDAPKTKRQFTNKGNARKNATATTYADRLYFALAAKRGAKRGADITGAAQKIWARRRQASGYTGAAWAPAIRDLGGTLNQKMTRFFRHGQSKEGGAKKATRWLHRAIIKNTAGGSEQVGYGAMVEAASRVYADRLKYITRKLQQRAKQVSGRRHHG